MRPVDDGSGKGEADAMRALYERLAPAHPSLAEPLYLAENQGKGGAIYSAWDAAAEGAEAPDWLAFVDADGAVSPSETVRLLAAAAALEPGASLFGARVAAEGTEVQRTPLRKALGQTFRLLVRLAFRLPIRDTQCGVKAVPRACYQKVRPLLVERRFVFDVELAARLARGGCPPREFPISWTESPGTRLRLRSALRMATSLLAVRWRLWRWRG